MLGLLTPKRWKLEATLHTNPHPWSVGDHLKGAAPRALDFDAGGFYGALMLCPDFVYGVPVRVPFASPRHRSPEVRGKKKLFLLDFFEREGEAGASELARADPFPRDLVGLGYVGPDDANLTGDFGEELLYFLRVLGEN